MGRQWTAQGVTLTGAVNKMKGQKRDADKASAELTETLKPDAQHVVLDKALSEVMLDVLNNRVQYGVTVSYTTPAKLGGSGSAMSKLDALAEDVPGTNVRSVRVNVSGTYETYQGLLGYLASLQGLPVAVVRLRVQEQAFEVALRVYGNKE
jgi:hypothetical protein